MVSLPFLVVKAAPMLLTFNAVGIYYAKSEVNQEYDIWSLGCPVVYLQGPVFLPWR